MENFDYERLAAAFAPRVEATVKIALGSAVQAIEEKHAKLVTRVDGVEGRLAVLESRGSSVGSGSSTLSNASTASGTFKP
eukprot:7480536-Lingulodinium_polyedra.AAC.1